MVAGAPHPEGATVKSGGGRGTACHSTSFPPVASAPSSLPVDTKPPNSKLHDGGDLPAHTGLGQCLAGRKRSINPSRLITAPLPFLALISEASVSGLAEAWENIQFSPSASAAEEPDSLSWYVRMAGPHCKDLSPSFLRKARETANARGGSHYEDKKVCHQLLPTISLTQIPVQE